MPPPSRFGPIFRLKRRPGSPVMCLALPARVLSADLAADTAVVALGNVKKTISTALLETVAEGDYVLVHVGYALNKLDPAEAEHTLDLMRQAGIAPGPAAGATDTDISAVDPARQ